MRSALGALACVAAVYASCSWFADCQSWELIAEQAQDNGGWLIVSPPTIRATANNLHPESKAIALYSPRSRNTP